MTHHVGKRSIPVVRLAACLAICLAAFSGLLPAVESAAFQVTYYYLPG